MRSRAVEAERNAILARRRQSAREVALLSKVVGVGPEFAAVLWGEGLFRHFGNRKQVAAYAGLAPTPWQSGSIDGEQESASPEIRDCGRRCWKWPGFGCDTTRFVAQSMVRRARCPEWRSLQEGDDHVVGPLPGRGFVEVCQRRRGDTGSCRQAMAT
jgi:hypothetical protein